MLAATIEDVVVAEAYPHLWGGSHVQTLALVAGLPARLVTTGLGPLTVEASRRGLPTTVVPTHGALARYGRTAGPSAVASLPTYWSRARHALTGAAVVHCNDHRGVLSFAPAARSVGARVVWHVHARAAGPQVDRACALLADALVLPSGPSNLDLRRFGRPVHVIPGIIPPPSASWAPGRAIRVVAVGRIFRSKGLDVLLDAVARLRGHDLPVAVDVIGGADPTDPSLLDELRAACRDLGIAGAVTWHGHLDDPWPVATRAHVLVQCSTGEETQGLALRQAILAGMPVVATDLAAWEDLPRDRVPRVPPGDARALARAIEAAVARPRTDPVPVGTVDDDAYVRAIAAVHDAVRR